MPETPPPTLEAADPPQSLDWGLALRRAGAGAAMAGIGFVGGFVAADMIPTSVELGPHEANVRIIPAHEVRIDTGVLGKITLSRDPLPAMGIEVDVEGIPDGDGAPLGTAELAQYEQLFSQPGRKTIIATIEGALINRGLEGGGLGAASLAGMYALLGATGRRAVGEATRSRRFQLTASIAASMLVLTASSPIVNTEHVTPENAVLASMGVHGVQVDGKILETLVNSYGPKALDYIRSLDKYYKQTESNLMAPYDKRITYEKENPDAISQMVADGSADEVLWISDNHCNTETAGIAADMAKKIHALFMLDTGDQTMGGTAAERLCVAVLPSRLGNSIPIFVALGNHDDRSITANMDRELHYRVLEGGVVEYKGYRLLGDSDVMRSRFSIPIHQEGPESPEQEGKRIAEAACKAGDVTIVAAHEPGEGLPSAQQGCAKLVADGHTHVFAAPKAYVGPNGLTSYQMVNGTTGGAAPDKMTFESRLGQDSTMVILVFDKQTKEPLGYRKIVMHPDQTVEVSQIYPFNTQVEPPRVPHQ